MKPIRDRPVHIFSRSQPNERGERILKELSVQDEREIAAELSDGNKLAAVKIYKVATGSSGASLMEAKKFIEALIDQLREESPGQFKPDSGGCAGLILLCVVLVATAFAQ
jgi:hypothetical protein